MEIKVTYFLKELFLVFSWFMLFTSNSVENPQIFLTSIMIYSGAIIFDLIFYAIDSKSKASISLKGAYFISITLAVLNGVCTIIAFLGAINCLTIDGLGNKYNIIIVKGTFTDIFSEMGKFSFGLRGYLIFVLFLALLEVLPGALILKDKNQKQVEGSD